MASFLHYAGLALLCVAAATPCLVPIVAPALIRRADAREAAKREQQSAPSLIESKETGNA